MFWYISACYSLISMYLIIISKKALKANHWFCSNSNWHPLKYPPPPTLSVILFNNFFCINKINCFNSSLFKLHKHTIYTIEIYSSLDYCSVKVPPNNKLFKLIGLILPLEDTFLYSLTLKQLFHYWKKIILFKRN